MQNYGFFADSASTEDALADFEAPSSVLDYERLDAFEKILERLLMEKRQKEEEQVCVSTKNHLFSQYVPSFRKPSQKSINF